MKFNSLLLTEYKRVIFMDSDGLVNANLDHLFFLPFPENMSIAAPQGYWFGKDGIRIGQPENYCIGDLSKSPDMFAVITSILFIPLDIARELERDSFPLVIIKSTSRLS